jgi:hypothetical protein
MILSRNSTAIRYYVFLLKLVGNDQYDVAEELRETRNLCQLVRALFFRTVGLFIGVSVLLAAAGFVLLAFYMEPVGTTFGLFSVAALAGFVFGSNWAVRKYHRYRCSLPPKPKKPDGVIVAYLKATKRGICPLIQIADEPAE